MKHRTKIKQINNIIIYFMPLYNQFICVAPDGRHLEAFAKQPDAENWCRNTKDFCGRVCR